MLVEGGSFKNGFLSAAVSQAMAGEISDINITGNQWGTIAARGLAAGVVGGTVASATGGNFENGMMTSAYGEIFNDCLHSMQPQQTQTQQMQDSLQTKVGYGIMQYEGNSLSNENVGMEFVAAYGQGISLGAEFTTDGINAHAGYIVGGLGVSLTTYTGRSFLGEIPDGLYSETSVRGSAELLPVGAGVSLQISPQYGAVVNPYISSRTEGIAVETSINYGWHVKW